MTFKEKLVILRKSKGLTQDEFASAVGVSRQAVYKWESGQSYPEVPKLLEMKILFTISIDELLDDNYDIPLPEKKKRKRAPKADAPKTEKEVKAAKPVAKVAPTIPKVEPAPAPKTEPVVPAAPKAEPAPAPKTEPVVPAAPKVEPAPTPKTEPATAVKEEPVVDTVPSPIILEDIVAEEEKKTEPTAKKGFFDRLFGRK